MCDRQKGIHNALSIEFRIAHVKYCARHIFANVKAKHTKTNFKAHFWAASRASNTRDFDTAMKRLKIVDSNAFETIRKIHPKFWSRHAFDKTCKSDHCTKKKTESFNAWLEVQRKLPLLTIMEFIRRKIMKRLVS